jgi:hypothetical protein
LCGGDLDWQHSNRQQRKSCRQKHNSHLSPKLNWQFHRHDYCIDWVQLVPPVGSDLT